MNKFAKGLLLLLIVAVLYCLGRHWYANRAWDEYEAFINGFVQSDGRVVDVTAGARSTSEGQAYGMFFALVANDRERFDRMLAWTEANLAGGDINRNLPAWLWGKSKANDTWGVLDANPASDADMWIAYSLFEAARLWKDPAYLTKARLVLWQIKTREVIQTEAAGAVLIPAPAGFKHETDSWRLNASYWPEFQLQYFSQVDPNGPWADVLNSSRQLIQASTVNGAAPDWFVFSETQGVAVDPKSKGVGSYDSIRVYLWAGMTPNSSWLRVFAPFVELISERGHPPEFVDPATGRLNGGEPLGFSAAVLPFLAAMTEDTLLEKQQERLKKSRHTNGALGDPAHYYDQVLALFGEGWLDKRFRFDPSGQLIPRWTRTCLVQP